MSFIRVACLIANATSYNSAAARLEHLRFMGTYRYYFLIFILLIGVKSLPYVSFQIKKYESYKFSPCCVEEKGGLIGPCLCEGINGREGKRLSSTEGKKSKNNNGKDDDDDSASWTEMAVADKGRVSQLMAVKQDSLLPVKGFVNNSPVPHLSDGFALIRIAPTLATTDIISLIKFFWIWYSDSVRTSSSKPSSATPTHAWAREFRVELKEKGPVQFDGELIPLRRYYGKVHRGVVDVFGTGTIVGHPRLIGDFTVWEVRWRVLVIFLVVVAVSFILLYASVKIVQWVFEISA